MAKVELEVVEYKKTVKTFWYSYMKEGKRIAKSIELEIDSKGKPVVGKVSLINQLYETEANALAQTNAIDFGFKVKVL